MIVPNEDSRLVNITKLVSVYNMLQTKQQLNYY